MKHDCIIIGSGPAALFAADILSANGVNIRIFEKRAGPAWKLLVAGSSGLNVSYDCPAAELASYYFNRQMELRHCFEKFGRDDWLAYLNKLGEETYLGTSKRYFVKNHKASSLLQAWLNLLKERNINITYNEEFTNFKRLPTGEIEVYFRSGRIEKASALLLALGGASWETSSPTWPQAFGEKGITFEKFSASNIGYHLQAPVQFFVEAQGKPIKGLILQTRRGKKQGEVMITKYGLEGTPLYTVGCSGPAMLDLKPELSLEKLQTRLQNAKGSVWQRIKRVAKLSLGALILVKYLAPQNALETIENAATILKQFPITLLEPRPLSEAISSKGGISWDELNENMELKKFPGVYCVGEMIDWDAPTGGFLLQACISTAYIAACGIRKNQESEESVNGDGVGD